MVVTASRPQRKKSDSMGIFAQVSLQWETAPGVVSATSCVTLDPHNKYSDPTEKKDYPDKADTNTNSK